MSTRIAAVFSSDLTNAKIGRAWLTYLPTADQTQFPDFIVSVYLSEATLVCLSVGLVSLFHSSVLLSLYVFLSLYAGTAPLLLALILLSSSHCCSWIQLP